MDLAFSYLDPDFDEGDVCTVFFYATLLITIIIQVGIWWAFHEGAMSEGGGKNVAYL
jgi:heme/copper-type cytochrome/quinol oxidase subunit 4